MAREKWFEGIVRVLTFCFLFCLCTFAAQARGDWQETRPFGPLPMRSQNPLYLQLLSMPLESAKAVQAQSFESTLQITYSNIFEYYPIGPDFVFYDMELWRTAFNWKYGISERLDVGVEIPVVSQVGGFLDGFIQGYHDTFGFPNGGRQREPQNQYRFFLSRNGQTLIDYNRQSLGLADVVLRCKYQLTDFHKPQAFKASVALYAKLPTGEVDAGLSSGFADFGVSVFGQKSFGRWHLNSQLGLVQLGGHKFLDEHLRFGFVQFAQSVEWQAFKSLSFLTEVSGNSSAFKGFSANPMTDMVMDLTLGVAGAKPLHSKIADELFYSVGFSEDVLSRGPSVDFSLQWQLGLRY